MNIFWLFCKVLESNLQQKFDDDFVEFYLEVSLCSLRYRINTLNLLISDAVMS